MAEGTGANVYIKSPEAAAEDGRPVGISFLTGTKNAFAIELSIRSALVLAENLIAAVIEVRDAEVGGTKAAPETAPPGEDA